MDFNRCCVEQPRLFAALLPSRQSSSSAGCKECTDGSKISCISLSDDRFARKWWKASLEGDVRETEFACHTQQKIRTTFRHQSCAILTTILYGCTCTGTTHPYLWFLDFSDVEFFFWFRDHPRMLCGVNNLSLPFKPTATGVIRTTDGYHETWFLRIRTGFPRKALTFCCDCKII